MDDEQIVTKWRNFGYIQRKKYEINNNPECQRVCEREQESERKCKRKGSKKVGVRDRERKKKKYWLELISFSCYTDKIKCSIYNTVRFFKHSHMLKVIASQKVTFQIGYLIKE